MPEDDKPFRVSPVNPYTTGLDVCYEDLQNCKLGLPPVKPQHFLTVHHQTYAQAEFRSSVAPSRLQYQPCHLTKVS